MSKNRLLWLPIEQEKESRLEATLWRMFASGQSITGRLRHRHMVTRLTRSFTDGHLEFERVAIAKTLDLNHTGLRHTLNKGALWDQQHLPEVLIGTHLLLRGLGLLKGVNALNGDA